MSVEGANSQTGRWENPSGMSAEQFLTYSTEFLTLTKTAFSEKMAKATALTDPKIGKNLNKLKNELLTLLVKKLSVTNCSLTLGNPTSHGKIANDIYTLCVCYDEGKLNVEFLTMAFNKSAMDTLNDTNNQVLEVMQNMSKKLEEGLLKIAETKYDNNSLSEKTDDPVDIEISRKRKKFSFTNPKKASPGEITPSVFSKLVLQVDQDKNMTTEVEEQAEMIDKVGGLADNHNKVVSSSEKMESQICDQPASPEEPKGVNILKKSFAQIINIVANNPKKKNIEHRKTTTNNLGNLNTNGNIKLVEINGQSHIMAGSSKNDGFAVSNGTKRVNKKNKGIIIGTALSEVRQLRAVSKPYTYHIGQWSLDTNPNSIRAYASNFAQVIDIIELNTHISRPYFRTFKLVAESYCDSAIMSDGRWPMGIVIKRWFPQKNKASNTKVNLPVTNGAALAKKSAFSTLNRSCSQ